MTVESGGAGGVMKPMTPATPHLPGVHVEPHLVNTINAVPGKGPRQDARNMTGIFLGFDKALQPKGAKKKKGKDKNDGKNDTVQKKTTIPPLARPRGIPRNTRTPTEERRYMYKVSDGTDTVLYIVLRQPNHSPSCAKPLCSSPRTTLPPLPQLPPNRYPVTTQKKMVELLRIREERRGFSGQILRQRKKSQASEDEENPPRKSPSPVMRTQTDFFTLTRKSPRHFTPVNNSGVNRKEMLSFPQPDGSDMPDFNTTVIHEVHRLAMDKRDLVGLVDCYKKVCKGNVASLQPLLPQKQNRSKPTVRYTGFTVKSYRAPNQAEIGADFSSQARPKTVIGPGGLRPFVPGPYFFKTYNPPVHHTARSLENPHFPQYDELGSQISSAPGAGKVSKSVSRSRRLNQSPQSAAAHYGKDSPFPPRSTPAPSRASVFSERHSLPPELLPPRPTPATGIEPVEIAVPAVDLESSVPGTATPVTTEPPIPETSRTSTTADPAVTAAPSQPEGNAEETPQNPAADEPPGTDLPPTIEEPPQAEDPPAPPVEITVDPAAEEPQQEPAEESTAEQTGGFDGEAQPDEDLTQKTFVTQPQRGETPHPDKTDPSGTDPVNEEMASSAVPIVMSVEDESGAQKPVEIDEPSKEEIEERILKSKNTQEVMEKKLERKMSRNKELQDLLQEHAQIVQETQDMSSAIASTPSSDKENTTLVNNDNSQESKDK